MIPPQTNKTCCQCQAVLPELIDSSESLSQISGLCANCAEWKAAWYADLQQRTGSDSATPVPEILTHFSQHADPQWLAIHRPSALELLKGYDLTESEKDDIAALMLGYCNLLERAGLLHYGATEAEAIESARPKKTPSA